MVVRAYIFETRGGGLLTEFEPVDLSWSVAGNDAETVDVTVDLSDRVEASREWRNLASPWNHSVAVDLGGRLYGGPVMPHDFADDSHSLKFTARGIRVALGYRTVMPVAALSTPLVTAAGTPDKSLDSAFVDYDYGTIGKKIVQQALAWPGWTDVPVEFHADRGGTRVSTYAAVDLKRVDDAIEDLSNLQDGPDIRFDLVWTGPDSFGWRYRSGTESQPRLQSVDQFSWEVGQASGLQVVSDPTSMGSVAWSVAGGSSDTTVAEMLYDPHLVTNGGLLLEQESGVDSSVSDREVLKSRNAETLRTARRPWEFWTITVPADRAPFPADYATGDLAEVVVTEDAPVAGGYVAPGVYTRRVAGLAGDLGDTVRVTFGEAYDIG